MGIRRFVEEEDSSSYCGTMLATKVEDIVYLDADYVSIDLEIDIPKTEQDICVDEDIFITVQHACELIDFSPCSYRENYRVWYQKIEKQMLEEN